MNQGQFNQPVPNAGFPPQGGGAPNTATQLIQNILTTPRQGGLPGAQPAGQQVGGGLAGVASTSENPSIMVYNDRTSYNEWEFIFDFSKQRGVVNPNAAGVIGTPASQIGTVAGPNPQPPILVGGGLGSLGQTGQQPIGADALVQDGAHSWACRARKISVEAVKPFSLTSAIRSNSRAAGPG